MLGSEAVEDGEDRAASSKKGGRVETKLGGATVDGVWSECVAGRHTRCAAKVYVQAKWATAGLPPVEGVPGAAWESCGCGCHTIGR